MTWNWAGFGLGAGSGFSAALVGYWGDKNFQDPNHKWDWKKGLPTIAIGSIVGGVYGGLGRLEEFEDYVKAGGGVFTLTVTIELLWKAVFRRAINPALGDTIAKVLTGIASRFGGGNTNSGSPSQPTK